MWGLAVQYWPKTSSWGYTDRFFVMKVESGLLYNVKR
jgi:hypothetical protein